MMDGWACRLTEGAEHKLIEPIKTTPFSPSLCSLAVALSLLRASLVEADECPPLGSEAAQSPSVLLRVLTCSVTHTHTNKHSDVCAHAVCKRRR